MDSETQVGELSLQKLLSLEREKRISAELLVEREHQALLQLKNILHKRKSDEKTTSKTSFPKDVRKSFSSSSMETLPRAFSQEFTTSVFDDLPSPVQQSLGLQTLAMTVRDDDQSHLSRAVAAINCHDEKALLRVVRESRQQKEFVTDHGVILLTTAVEQRATGCLRVLLQSGCDPNNCSPQHSPPILQVVKSGSVSLLQVLIDHNADVNLVDRLGYCPLYLALQGGRGDLVETILMADPKMDVMTGYDNSVVHAAVLQDDHTLLRMVVVKLRESHDHETVCCVLNKRNEDGYTPLHQAAAEGYTRCVEVLCACPEVDTSLTDFRGKTSFDIASPDCQILIEAKTFKDISVVVETGEAAQPKLIVGVVRMLPHHTWTDLLSLVGGVMKNFRNVLRGGMGTGLVQGTRTDPVYPVSLTQLKIPTELKQTVNLGSESLFDELQSVVEDRIKTISKFDLQISKMSASLIGKYSLIEEAELENEDTKDATKNQQRNNPYQIVQFIETVGEPLEIVVDLGETINELAVSSLIPYSVLEEYTQLAGRSRLLLVHGSADTDLSFLSYNLVECVRVTTPRPLTEVRIHVHPKFTRDNFICALRDNNLLEKVGEESSDRDNSSLCILIMEGINKLPDYDILEDMCILMESQEKGRGVWLSLTDQSSALSFESGKYKMKNVSHFIATRSIHKSASLSSVVMDTYAHIWLSETEEPIAGRLLRALLCQMIHARKGQHFSKFDSLYQVVVWVWQFWVTYNHFVNKMDLHQLKIGPKVFLTCPVNTNDPDAVYNWFVEMWNFHLVPRIREIILDPSFKPKSKKTNRAETIRVLMLFLTLRVMQLTCPLYPEGKFNLIKNLYSVGELKHLTFPAANDLLESHAASAGGGTKRSPKILGKFNSPAKSNSGSPKPLYRSMGNLTEISEANSPVLKKHSIPYKQSTPSKLSSTSRPKSGNLFGRTSTLRKSLFKGSRNSLFAVDEEEKNKKKSTKSKSVNHITTDPQLGAEQDMEDFFNQLMSSKTSRLDEQRAVMTPPTNSLQPPTHHKISVSPSESSHESITSTSPSRSVNHYQSEEDSWTSHDSNRRHYVNIDMMGYNPRIAVMQRETRSRSKSEDNVFSLSERRSSLEDILRPTSEISLGGHRHEISNSSDLLSDTPSSIDSISYHESVPSYSTVNPSTTIDEHLNENISKTNEIEETDQVDQLHTSTSVVSSLADLVRSDSQSLSFYSATLGVSATRRSSNPVTTPVVAGGNGRRLSSPPTMMTWEEEAVEM